MTTPAAAPRQHEAYGRRGVWRPVDPSTYQSPMTAPPADPRVVFAGPGYTSPPTRVSGLAMAGFVLGLLAFPFPPLALLAIGFGAAALHVTARGVPGRGFARGGLILGIAAAAVWLLFIGMIAVFSS